MPGYLRLEGRSRGSVGCISIHGVMLQNGSRTEWVQDQLTIQDWCLLLSTPGCRSLVNSRMMARTSREVLKRDSWPVFVRLVTILCTRKSVYR